MTSAEWLLLSNTIREEADRLSEKYNSNNAMKQHAILLQSFAIIAGRMGIKLSSPMLSDDRKGEV